MDAERYRTGGGIEVCRVSEELPFTDAIESLVDRLDRHRGVVLASSYEYPGRYTRWDIGFADPPLAITARGRRVVLAALNARGRVMLPWLAEALARVPEATWRAGDDSLEGEVGTPDRRFTEEERSRQPSVFSVLRAVIALFAAPDDRHVGLYGAFGYDLAFQFEPVRLRLPRPAEQRDLVLYVPDELVVVDHRREIAVRRRYEFARGGASIAAAAGGGASHAPLPAAAVERDADHAPGEYAAGVRRAREAFARGDLFEVVPGQVFYARCPAAPSEVFRRLRERNPAPYGFLINLGEGEYLVGGSPEMYVRVEGRRVETCPISGTVARGRDALEDAAQIRRLLASSKDEAELTMCTDVDRNDKARVCEPGSVRVLGRRQIEMYSRVIHTVDHVEGRLRAGFDALDAFLAHAWAVTVTGAPKAWAMQFLEDHEQSPRAWYGGAVGVLGFDGGANTGLTLRTVRIAGGVAEVRAGATLLWDSDPDEEERETRLKAAALLDAVARPRVPSTTAPATGEPPAAVGPAGRRAPALRAVLVDHQDSFVHTLADYVRQAGAEVTTVRPDLVAAALADVDPELVVLSPGPGRPADFDVAGTLARVLARGPAVFGVCLGLQGIVEHLGGELAVLAEPVHGKPSRIRVLGGRLFEGLPREFEAGRYHSLFARRDRLPPGLHVTAESAGDRVVMAIQHASLPVAAVQFHPESILTLGQGVGLALVANVVAWARARAASRPQSGDRAAPRDAVRDRLEPRLARESGDARALVRAREPD